MKNYILYTLTFVALNLSLFGQTKTVHLAHGLGGSEASWEDLESALNNCPNVNTTIGDYNSSDGIGAYEGDFESAVGATSSNYDLAVGHSFGGIALRSMDQINNGLFGGYITVASPHGGAKLANSVNNGQLENYLENACDEVLNDPITAANNALLSSPISWVIGVITSGFSIGSDYLCENLWEIALIAEGILVGGAFTGNGQSISDLELEGAASNLPASTLPSVAITGFQPEEVEVHWALLGDRMDKDVAQEMQDMENSMLNMADFLFSVAPTFQVQWWNPATWLFGGLQTGCINTAQELIEGANWIDASESGWNELIGAGGGGKWITEEIEVDIAIDDECVGPEDCNGISDDGNPLVCQFGQCVDPFVNPCSTNSNNGTSFITITTYIAFPELENDGVVVKNNQLLPGALRVVDTDNVSHFGETKDPAVLSAISDQFQPGNTVADVFVILDCQF